VRQTHEPFRTAPAAPAGATISRTDRPAGAQRSAHRTPSDLPRRARLRHGGAAATTPGAAALDHGAHEMAQQLYEQLALWLPPVEDGGPPRYLFADPDALPYERITWSNETRQRRLTALAALQARSGPPPVVVASARALMQKTLPPRELRLALRAIKVGSPLRLEQMTVAWVQNGYTPSRSSRNRAHSPAAAVWWTSGRPTCRCRCASTYSATRWRACASSTRPASARCARCRASRSGRAARCWPSTGR
jgi:hypothetical protein